MKGSDTDDILNTDGDKCSDTDKLLNLKNEIGAWLLLPKFNTWEDSLYNEQKQNFWQKLISAKLQYNTLNFREGLHNALRKRGTIWPDKMTETKKYPFIYNMVNALTASFLGLAVVVPMDFLRALHIMYRNWPTGSRRITFHSLFACDVYPFRDRAFTTMYRDMAKDFMLIFPQFAIKLAVNEYYVYAITSRQEEAIKNAMSSQVIAAMLTGVSTDFLTSPIKMYRWHWKDVANNGPFFLEAPTPRNLLRQIFMRSVGRERFKLVVQSAVFENFVFCSTYFPIKYLFFHLVPDDKKKDHGVLSRFATGFTAATIAQIFSSPVSAVKEFLGHIPIPDKDRPGRENINEFKTVYEATKHFYKVNGFRGFFDDWLCKSLVRSRIFAIVNVLYDMEVAALIYDALII